MKLMKLTYTAALAAGLAAAAGTAAFAQQRKVSASPSPQTLNAVGTTDAAFAPVRWPVFGASKSDNEACANRLRAMSGKFMSETHPGSYKAAKPVTILSKTVDFAALGMSPYRKTAKLLVSWTTRVEAYQVIVNPWRNTPRLCHPWHGNIEENFTGGEVDTMLFVGAKQYGNTATMTIPPLGSKVNTNASDPTITNSVTLTAADFGGQFPETLTLDVRWLNRTVGSSIKSPASMRNMTVLVLPVGSH